MDDIKYDRENNHSLFNRGLNDAYFDRGFNPHWIEDGKKIPATSTEDIDEYNRGFRYAISINPGNKNDF